ncbi:MAG: LytR C-terminal domain-containing protein [Blastococcus sp.]
MGRHAQAGSDGLDWGNAPVAAGRRRTDVPDALWSGAPSDGLSDHPTDPGRARTERAAGGLRTPDSPRQLSRSRLPLPPVPPVPAGPRTTAAPFRAVPSPEPRGDAMVPAGPSGPLDRATLMSGNAAAPARLRPSRPWTADDAAVATGGQSIGGGRTSVPSPRLSRSTPAGGPASPPYGDWTKPRSGDTGRALGGPAVDDDYLSGPVGLRVAAAPSTTMIPERSVTGRRSADAYDDGYDDSYDYDDEPAGARASAPAPVRGPATGPVVGGRAAKRAERQAAELARQKAAKRNGVPAVAALDEVDGTDRKPRRVAKGLVAMVVVACGVLGAYSYVSPHTKDAAAQKPAASATDPVVAPETAALPPLATSAPVVAPPAVVAPVRVPVTVLNATSINGLAAKVKTAIGAKGWTSPGVGAYKGGDVAASTVFFTQGDEKQRQAAVQLVDQFPQLTGPAPRFFQLPAGVSAPGLVVVVTGDWKP